MPWANCGHGSKRWNGPTVIDRTLLTDLQYRSPTTNPGAAWIYFTTTADNGQVFR